MCGIIAISGKQANNVTDAQADGMLSCLLKRGPDDKGFDRFDGALIGQTRLSIVDVAHGHQPMRDNSRPHTIVFNGEIYGYQDLRKELEGKGHAFSTDSDTEVILKAYAEYGRECVKHIDGMFAFAIWDDSKKELFIARDRFGKKPFYFAYYKDTFMAASEIKSLFESGLVKGEVDPGALDDYLRLMYIPSRKTVYKNVSMLPPAHAGVVKDGRLETWQYWKLEKKPLDISYEDAKKRLKELFDEAVRKRMIADVEIGSLLSGGVDSTLVTLYAQKYSKTPLKTFSVGYEGHKNELLFAREASKKIGTDHRELDVRADLARELEEIAAYMDEPHGDSSNFPQHMISGLAASKVKVALTGDGADELFMGYGWYQKHWHTPRWKPSRWIGNEFTTAQKLATVFDESERASLLLKKAESDEAAFEQKLLAGMTDPIAKINAFDIGVYLPGQLLSKVDRTSMMHSLEIRSPFLDTALAEFAYSLPASWKLGKTENKIILKDVLAETFPREFVYRRKQGFGAPIDTWLTSDTMKALAADAFREDNPMFSYIDRAAALRIKDAFYESGAGAQKLWSLLSLALWFRTHSKHHA